MYSKRDIGMMIAGAMIFHTIGHIILAVSGTLPISVFFFTLTHQMNMIVILVRGLLAVASLKWASQLQ